MPCLLFIYRNIFIANGVRDNDSYKEANPLSMSRQAARVQARRQRREAGVLHCLHSVLISCIGTTQPT